MGMSLEKNCGNCEYTGVSSVSTPCCSCKSFSNWIPDAYMRNKYTPNQLREMTLGRPKPVHVIKDVIFNPPATIVKWGDGTKTVVKCQEGDEFDPEKGVAMAIAKKAMGNSGSYFNHIKKWTKKYEDSTMIDVTVNLAPNSFMAALWAANKEIEDRLRECRADVK